jgi:hypothetical protein
MMDCARYRRSVLADPGDPDPELREHRAHCPECGPYTEGLLRFESRLDRALKVAVPADPKAKAGWGTGTLAPIEAAAKPPRASALRRRNGWLAMAASVAAAAVVVGGLWLSAAGPSLAADVVTHMAGEPQAWRRTDVPVPSNELQEVLRDSHLTLGAGAGMVSYASSCEFRGHRVPHLVVQTASGPATVMVLVHDHVPKSVRFDEQGYRGVIVPVAGHGSLAVLTRGNDADLAAIERIASRVQDSIVWTG